MTAIQIKQSSQIIEVDMDLPESPSSPIRNKICRGTACDFSNPNSKDANERSKSMQKLLIAVVLCIIFVSVEVVGGIKANSLAILTDAAHLLSDVAAFAISLFSLWASGWEANPRQSYGFFRIEILGALVSIQLIWLLTGILVYEAVARMVRDGGEVHGFLMFAVSTFGLVVNIVMAMLLGHDHGHAGHGNDHSHSESDHDHRDHHDEHHHSITAHHHHNHHHNHGHDGHEPLLNQSDGTPKKKLAPRKRNINVHSAYLHVIGDSIHSAGVMIGGAIIWYDPGLKIIDLICTIAFSVIVLVTTVRMLRSILEVLMESTPREVDAMRIENGLKGIEGVVAVHELHIWAITVGKVLLACHVTVTP